MKVEIIDINKIKANPNNPRLIKDIKYKQILQSISEFPQMVEIRPIVVNKDMMIIGGNMRYKAMIELGYNKCPVIIADKLNEKQQKEFTIKDNSSYGQWDYDILMNEWNQDELTDWHFEIPGIDEMQNDFKKENNKSNKLICYLTNEQLKVVNEAFDIISKSDEYKYSETFGNIDENGNILYCLIKQWVKK